MKLVILFKLSLEPSNIWLVKYIGGREFHSLTVEGKNVPM